MIEKNLSIRRGLFLSLICLGLMTIAQGLHEIPVYRLIASEENGQLSGSKIHSFNLVGSHFSGDLLRKLGIIHFNDISEESLSNVLNKKLAGLLIILPQNATTQESNTWEIISEKLVKKTLPIAVYFSWEERALLEFYEKSRASLSGEDSKKNELSDIHSNMNFIVSGTEPKISKSVVLEDFYGVFDETTPVSKISGASTPIIMVIASYDSFTLVPDAGLGVSKFTSGAIALMNVAKHLSQLYELNNQNLRYNVIYYLTSSKTFNFEGLETWLNKAETSKVVSRIEFALLIDSINSGNKLNLVIYNEDTNKEAVDNTVQNFKRLSKSYDIKLNVEKSSQNIFNKKFPILKIEDENSSDSKRWISTKNFNRDIITKNSLFLTEFFVSAVYNITKNYPIVDEKSLNKNYMDSLINLFSAKPTFPTQIIKDSILSQELFRAFSDVAKHAHKVSYSYSNPQFYSSSVAQLKITKINSPFFDFYLFAGNIIWLSLLYVFLNKTKSQDSKKK